jgi:hypothetical protein
MRKSLLAASVLACFLALPAAAQLSINFGGPGVHIGINLPVYPTLQRVPGYPVYYAPSVNSNYFFYDGLYWVYDNDNWYSSSWYNGPWHTVDPYYVPSYVLRVPVRYYRHAPTYFRSWRADSAPRWGEHFGASWEQRRSGWDRWDRKSAPAPAPLPTYQREYSGNRYPQVAQQATIESRSYRYQPRETVTQQHFEQRRQQVQVQPAQQRPAQQQAAPQPQFTPQREQQRQQPLPAAPIPQPMPQRQGLPQPMSPRAAAGAGASRARAGSSASPGTGTGRCPRKERRRRRAQGQGP